MPIAEFLLYMYSVTFFNVFEAHYVFPYKFLGTRQQYVAIVTFFVLSVRFFNGLIMLFLHYFCHFPRKLLSHCTLYVMN